MKRILLAALFVVSCKDSKPTSEPAQNAPASPSPAAAKPAVEEPPAEPVEASPPTATGTTAAAGSAVATGSAAPADCDAEKLKEAGMQSINVGEHPKALTSFEASLACKDDPYVVQLAFMESCASNNPEKAKLYFKKLTPAQQAKFKQICARQNPPVAYE